MQFECCNVLDSRGKAFCLRLQHLTYQQPVFKCTIHFSNELPTCMLKATLKKGTLSMTRHNLSGKLDVFIQRIDMIKLCGVIRRKIGWQREEAEVKQTNKQAFNHDFIFLPLEYCYQVNNITDVFLFFLVCQSCRLLLSLKLFLYTSQHEKK